MAWNIKTGKWEPTPEAAAINKSVYSKPLTPIEKAIAAQEESARVAQQQAEGITGVFGAGAKFVKGLGEIGTPETSMAIKPVKDMAKERISMGVDPRTAQRTDLTKISTPVAKAPVANPALGGLAKILSSAIDQTAPIMPKGLEQLPEWTPAINMPSAPAATPTLWDKTKGIASGIGKWAEDPKIARALMTAGLSTLATEPRHVPFSNAEMLGKAGLVGIGAYDTEVAKEAARKETARKAGIEGRETSVKEMGAAAELGKLFTPVSVQAYMADPSKPLVDRTTGESIEAMEGKPFRDKDGQWYTPYFNKKTGKVITQLLTASTAVLGREPKGEGGDRATERKLEGALQTVRSLYLPKVRAALEARGNIDPDKIEGILADASNNPPYLASLLPAELQIPFQNSMRAAEQQAGIEGVGRFQAGQTGVQQVGMESIVPKTSQQLAQEELKRRGL